jgi:ribosomal protein S18 acetylase RimI-like enzyme
LAFFQKDIWLSAQLGRPSYRCEKGGAEALIEELDGQPSFAYARISCDDAEAAVAMQAAGFRVVDVNLGFTKAITKASPNAVIRDAAASEENAVANLAGQAYRFSRFHLDPGFSAKEAGKLKEAWVRNFFRGQRGDRLFVAEHDGKISGFLLALCTDETCVIDLIAVDQDSRRRGLAADLIAAFENAFPRMKYISAGTQAANIPSVRLYEKLGFRLTSSQYLLHRHS